jgi:hypothetical protein
MKEATHAWWAYVFLSFEQQDTRAVLNYFGGKPEEPERPNY